MKTYTNLYNKICSEQNLFFAYRKARKGKTKKVYVKEFEKNLIENINKLHEELINFNYKPKKLKRFIIRDPKTRVIHSSDFRDRIVHHTIVRILEPIFEKTFIYDSCANRKRKGNLFAIKRFEKFQRKISKNGKLVKNSYTNNSIKGYCLKADIKHYFPEINHEILINIIKKKINDEKTINLIIKILKNTDLEKGMPLGNLTSQFFANIYLNELDYFVKHRLRAKWADSYKLRKTLDLKIPCIKSSSAICLCSF